MKEYLKNVWVKIGLVLVVFGWGPLWMIVLLATIGLWPDPNPNPIGPGLFFSLPFGPPRYPWASACFRCGAGGRNRRMGPAFSGKAAKHVASRS